MHTFHTLTRIAVVLCFALGLPVKTWQTWMPGSDRGDQARLISKVEGMAQIESGIQITTDEVKVDFPWSLIFRLSAESSREITTVKLIFGTNAKTCSSASVRKSIDFESGKNISAEWKWEFKRSGALPPGSQVWWQWEIGDESGNQLLTEVQTAVIQDQRHEWQSLSKDGLTVQWYDGPLSFGTQLLRITQRGLESLEHSTGTGPSGEVWVTVYPTFEELREALLFSNVWTGGVAMPEYNAMILGVPDQDLEWAALILPHELAHLIVKSATFNCKGNDFPVWLNEGIAEYTDGPYSDSDQEKVIAALEAGQLPSLISLEDGFPGQPEKAARAYVQSEMTVSYLVEEFGFEQMRELLVAYQAGQTIDKALEEVYGFNTYGLDTAWRASLGFGPPPGPTPTAPSNIFQQTPTKVPTLALRTSLVQPSPTLPPTPTAMDTPLPPTQTPSPTPTGLPPTAAASPAEGARSGLQAPALIGGGLVILLALGVLVYSNRSKQPHR
jgi:hypothetical protein